MSYIGTEPKDIRSFGRTKFDYTATQGQTAFTGADDDGKVLAFTTGQIEVYVNGILMDDSDFTTTGTGTVTLATAANLNDVVNVVSFETNIPDSNYVPASGGTFTGNITASGTLGVTGAVTASNGLTVDDDGATPLTVDRATSDGTVIDVQKNGSTVGGIGTYSGYYTFGQGDTGLLMNAASDVMHPWNYTGNSGKDNLMDLGASSQRFKDIYLGGGAYLGGTGAANKLDDYEEGTWSPVLGATSGTGPTVSYAGASPTGWYTKVGRLVHVAFYIPNFTVSGTVSGNIGITGLPFAKAAVPSSGGVISAYYVNWARPNFVALKGYSGTTLGFLSQQNGATWAWETLGALTGGSNRYLEGAITYTAT